MARRNDHSRKDIKNMAINAGLEIIEAKGFLGLSTRKVASKIGYSVGTLYNVFENFNDLVFHINAITLKELYYYVEENLNSQQGVEAIKKIGASYIDYSIESSNKWNALFEYNRPPESEVPDWYLEKVNKLLTIPEQYLMPMFGGDEDTAKKVSRILWGGIHGICSLGLTHRLGGDGAEVLKAMAYSLIENYLKGITQDIEK
ncbi:MAG: TetR/AcrR family transcriptional regulator [Promethearchaeota archaeon]|jgi:AcrR family transcriptional regulator